MTSLSSLDSERAARAARQIAVYFIQISDGPPNFDSLRIKIGKSKHPLRRIEQHARPRNGARPEHVRTLAVVWGEHETAVHQHFRHLLWPNEREVFRPEPELIDYIRWLRDQHYVWVEDDPYGAAVESLEIVPFDQWRPSPQRRKDPNATELWSMLDPLKLPDRDLTGDDYYTNSVIIEAARRTLGSIDLDPASHAVANRTVRASTFFTKADDGLSRPWFGRVWLNPPFSGWAEWSRKALAEVAAGNVLAMCALAANRTTSANYFGPFLEAADAACSTRGRIPFGGIAGDALNDGHTIYYFGPHRERFRDAFQAIGKVWFSPR